LSAEERIARTQFMVFHARGRASRISRRPAELATFWMTQSPGFKVDDVGEQQERRSPG